MATISNTPRPGYVFDVTDNVWYPIGVGGHSHSEIAKTIADAKGDLIVGTAADTVDRLAVGNNGETLVANSSTSTGLGYAVNQSAGRNLVINGAFDNWQRGTSFTADDVFTADRWKKYRGTTGATFTQQALSGLNNPYYLRVQRDSGNTSTSAIYAVYNSESNIASQLRGLTATISFYARKGTNYSATSNGLVVNVISGTGTDQGWLAYTGATYQLNQTVTLTSSWTKYTYTTSAFQASANQFKIQFEMAPTGTAGAADYYDISDIQFEVGSNATSFTRAGGTIQGELAACQRYYYRLYGGAGLSMFGPAMAYNTTSAYGYVTFPVQMRTRPLALETSGTAADYATFNSNTATTVCTAVPTYQRSSVLTGQFTTASGNLVQGNATFFADNNTTAAYLGWSAEL